MLWFGEKQVEIKPSLITYFPDSPWYLHYCILFRPHMLRLIGCIWKSPNFLAEMSFILDTRIPTYCNSERKYPKYLNFYDRTISYLACRRKCISYVIKYFSCDMRCSLFFLWQEIYFLSEEIYFFSQEI